MLKAADTYTMGNTPDRTGEPKIHPTARLRNTKLGRFTAVSERVELLDCTVGDYSYLEHDCGGLYSTIGKFCSIAAFTRINAVQHPMDRVTTHKISYRPNEYFLHKELDSAFREWRLGNGVAIGNDVWIGHAAILLPGVSIGNGAVVGAGAVVTHDVAPYTIVAGVPAKPLRQRFPQPVAERLQALAWWDWPHERLGEAVDDMRTLSVEAFLEKYER